jgi:arylsulfatase A
MKWIFPLLALGLSAGSVVAADRPNIVYVLCDDLGYGDLSCTNPDSKLKTPHFDRVAAEGVSFTDAHSGSAVCSPTRYGVLTGRYAWRSKLQSGVLGGLSPRLIEPGRMTVASFLKDHGYHTACIGKWHLGMDWVKLSGKEVSELNIEPRAQVFNVDYSRPYTNGPTAVGFDEYFGISASLDMVPYTFLRNDRVTVLPTEDKSFEMIVGRPGVTTRQGPTAPDFHADQVLPALTAEAVNYIGSRAAAAKEGKPFFLYLPYASPHTPIQPTKDWLGKSGLNEYGDFVLQQDACLGEVLQALDDHGLAKDTLVVVTSDNGCSPQAKYDELLPKGHNPSYIFRGTKADLFEGGHRVPHLVRWPAKVPAGKTTDRLTHLGDLFATCAGQCRRGQRELSPGAAGAAVAAGPGGGAPFDQRLVCNPAGRLEAAAVPRLRRLERPAARPARHHRVAARAVVQPAGRHRRDAEPASRASGSGDAVDEAAGIVRRPGPQHPRLAAVKRRRRGHLEGRQGGPPARHRQGEEKEDDVIVLCISRRPGIAIPGLPQVISTQSSDPSTWTNPASSSAA